MTSSDDWFAESDLDAAMGTAKPFISLVLPVAETSNTHSKKEMGSDVSAIEGAGAPSDALNAVISKLDEYLLIEDRDAVPLMLAAVVAHWLDCSPVWLMIIGPPSSAKTELITLLRDVKHVHFLSDLSPNTLASGFNVSAHTKEPSLLDKLKDNVIAIKEMTTILEKRAEARAEIFAQLREVYDGVFNKNWGTGKDLVWEGRVSLVAGVTDEIDRHHVAMSALGPRFLFLRMQQADRKAVASRALGN